MESSKITLACESNLDSACWRHTEAASGPKEKFSHEFVMLLVGAVFASLAFGVLLAYAHLLRDVPHLSRPCPVCRAPRGDGWRWRQQLVN